MKNIGLALAVTMSMLVAGCKDSNPPEDASAGRIAQGSDAATGATPEPKVAIDWNKPNSAYLELTYEQPTPEQALDAILLDAGLSAREGFPVNWDHVAKMISAEYYKSSDVFKQKEMLAAAQPLWEQRLRELSASPYVVVVYSYSNNLDSYDFDKKAFPIQIMRAQSRLGQGITAFNYSPLTVDLEWTNSKQASHFPVPDQALAKRIEELRSGPEGKTPLVKIYFHANPKLYDKLSTSFHHYLNNPIYGTITKVEILTRANEVLASFQPEH